MQNPNQLSRFITKTILAGALLAFGSVAAQVAPASAPATKPASDPAAVDEAIELSPFFVTSDQDVGYQAADTLAGSRLNTPLRDTPASISIMTSEFLSDIGALTLDEAIIFGNNVEADDIQLSGDNFTFEFFSMFRIRGQAATVARNYFRWKVPTNTFNVERIEEARGPNSILFGIASAGGLISTSTKQAHTDRNFRRAQLVYGSYDQRRASIDLNATSFNGKLGVRFNAVVSDTHGYKHHVFHEDNRGHIALKWQVTPNTVVRAEYEKGQTRSNKANTQQIADSVLRWYNAGQPVMVVTSANSALGIARNGTAASLSVNIIEEAPGVFTNFDARQMGTTQGLGGLLISEPTLVDSRNFTPSVGGPGQVQDSSFDTYSVFVEHKFGRNTFLHLAYNHQNYDFEAWQATSAHQLRGDPNEFLRDGVTPNPNAGRLYFDTYWTHRLRAEELDNLRLMASTELNFGKWGEYRLAGLAEREESNWMKANTNEAWFNEATNRGAFSDTPSNSSNRAMRRHYITPGDYGTYFASFNNPGKTGMISGMVDPSNPSRTLKTVMSRTSTSDFDDPQEQDTLLAAAQAYYFGRKLVVAGGYRSDTLYLHEGARGVRDPVTNDVIVDNVNNPRNHRTARGNTRTYGAVYHALPWLSFRYNKSNSLELANVGVRLMPRPNADGHFIGNRVGDNPQGQGEDYGIDLNLFEGKVYVRATRFDTTRAGAQRSTYGGTQNNPTVMSNRILDALELNGLITQAERDNHQLDMGGSEFDVASTGYEFSLTANPTRNWRLSANYSQTDSVTSNVAPEIQVWVAGEIPYFRQFDQNIVISTGDTIGQEIERWLGENDFERSIEGLATVGNRPRKFNLVSRYSFSEGRLKGLFVGGTGRYMSKQIVGVTSSNELVYGSSITRADAFLGYDLGQLRPKFLKNLVVQLNVYNVFNQHDPLITRYSDPDAAVLTVSRLLPQEPRYWRITAKLSF